MNILALDLGTKTGWANKIAIGPCHAVKAGTWDFTQKKKSSCCTIDQRLVLLRNELRDFYGSNSGISLLAYEDVKFVRSQAQAHLWSGFRAILWLFAYDTGTPIICCPVQTLKKFATGHGNADKDAMALAYYEKTGCRPDQAPLDDNAIDAWHLLHWAETQI